MKYTYKDVFDLRDYLNERLENHVDSDRLVCRANYEFVSIFWENKTNSSINMILEHVSRDECYYWLCGFITFLDIKESKVIDSEKSWWGKHFIESIFKKSFVW